MKIFYVYILTSKKRGTLYIGVTSNLVKRVYEHRESVVKGFTKKYHVIHLVYFESCDDPNTAIAREKQLKNWRREWKIQLIERDNPDWNDLYDEIMDSGSEPGMTGGRK